MATLISTFFQPQRMVLLPVQLVLQSMMLPSLQPSDPVMVINRVCPKIKRGVFCVSVFHHCSFGEELERWDLPTTFDQQQTQKSLCSYNRTTEELTTGAAEPEEVVIVGRSVLSMLCYCLLVQMCVLPSVFNAFLREDPLCVWLAAPADGDQTYIVWKILNPC